MQPKAGSFSTHPDGQSIIKGGDFDGKTLTEYISENGSDILGENAEKIRLLSYSDKAD